MIAVPSPLRGDAFRLAALVARALLYALAIIALVVFAPGGEHAFVYLGF